jgi:hypothetical protein
MRISIIVLAMFCIFGVAGGCATTGARGPAEIIADGCKTELETYCKDVTLGEGRGLACLYAHEDKLSNRCEYALYDAASRLEQVVNALAYMASECRDDLKVYCSDTMPGEGRILKCLDQNKDKVSARCKHAQKDVGLK